MTWLYRARSASGDLLYVGVTRNPRERFLAHRRKSAWFPQAAACEWQSFSNSREAFRAETDAIATESPRFNVPRLVSTRRALETRYGVEAARGFLNEQAS